MSELGPNVVPLSRAFLRPDHLWGCERAPVLVVTLATVLLTVVAQNLVAAGIGAAVWTCSLWALRRMAQADADMCRVYLRQLRYAAHYPARSTVAAEGARHRYRR